MTRNTKKRRFATVPHNAWAQTLQRHIEAEGDKAQKREQEHQAEKDSLALYVHYQAMSDARWELFTMLEREFPDPALREALAAHVRRALNAAHAKFEERK